MGTFDRSKFKGVSSDVLKEQQKKVSELNPFANRTGFVKLTPGANIIRVFPPHNLGDSYAYPKAVNWLPFIEEVEDKKKNTKSMEEVRRPIFNARYHAGAPKDLVDEYIKFAYKLFTEEIQDESEREKKLKPILDWKLGIKTQVSWIFYGKKFKSDGTKEFGRIEITNGLMDKFNKIASRVSSTGQPMTIDCFSGADDGKAVQITWNKEEPDNKKKYEPTLLHETDWTLTDEELAEFAEKESLKDIYTDCFVRTDFEKQVKGLQNFDDKHGLGLFGHDEFLDICEEISNYLEEKVFPVTDKKIIAPNQAEEAEGNNPLIEPVVSPTPIAESTPPNQPDKPTTSRFVKKTPPVAGSKEDKPSAGKKDFLTKYKK